MSVTLVVERVQPGTRLALCRSDDPRDLFVYRYTEVQLPLCDRAPGDLPRVEVEGLEHDTYYTLISRRRDYQNMRLELGRSPTYGGRWCIVLGQMMRDPLILRDPIYMYWRPLVRRILL